jgi:hypothetical protein
MSSGNFGNHITIKNHRTQCPRYLFQIRVLENFCLVGVTQSRLSIFLVQLLFCKHGDRINQFLKKKKHSTKDFIYLESIFAFRFFSAKGPLFMKSFHHVID